MIRKSTLAVLVIFILAVVGLLLLQNSPNSPLSATPTPLATSAPTLLSGWNAQEIVLVFYTQPSGGEIRLMGSANGTWTYGNEGPVPQGKVEQLISEILAMRTLAQMQDGLNLKDLLLEAPTRVITLQTANGKTATIQIGGLTPTQSGYYVKVDQNAPVIVGKDALETVLKLLDESKPATPTPEAGAADPTVTPKP